MSEDYRLSAELRFVCADLDVTALCLLCLTAPLLKLGRKDVAGRLTNLVQKPAVPDTGITLPDDDTLAHLLLCVPPEERKEWLRAMDQLFRDDDAPRFERLMDVLRVRVAH